MGEAEIVLGAGLHRSGNIDQQQDFSRPPAALQSRQFQHFAVVARRVAQGPPQIDQAAASAHAPIAAPLRQPGRCLAGEPAQRLVTISEAEAALDQCFRAGGGLPGFIGFVRQRRLAVATLLLLHAHDVVVVLGVAGSRLVLAEEMNAKQRVIGAMALGRRGQHGEAGAADVFEDRAAPVA